jgi:hypothetical protein
MNGFLLPIAIGLGIGLVLGWFAARESAQRKPIYGGIAAKTAHYLGAAAFVSALPSALIELITGQGIVSALAASFSLIAISLILLVVFAALERPAIPRRPAEAEGWTAEKARSSGL